MDPAPAGPLRAGVLLGQHDSVAGDSGDEKTSWSDCSPRRPEGVLHGQERTGFWTQAGFKSGAQTGPGAPGSGDKVDGAGTKGRTTRKGPGEGKACPGRGRQRDRALPKCLGPAGRGHLDTEAPWEGAGPGCGSRAQRLGVTPAPLASENKITSARHPAGLRAAGRPRLATQVTRWRCVSASRCAQPVTQKVSVALGGRMSPPNRTPGSGRAC